ncbi:MAG TPA: amino acid adenylation domain-containing protein, partial [Thermoanaerobaculia bacterium]|nr:amino acid adenylation domain-containing protein [Thermoanaerobaculia bacterium]
MSKLTESFGRLTAQQRKLLLVRLRKQDLSADALFGKLERRKREGPVDLSSAQRRLWFLEQLDRSEGTGGAGTYNVSVAVRLRGRLDAPLLADSLARIAARHEALRTTFHLLDGRPQQRIHPRLAPEIVQLDLSALPAGRREPQAAVAAGEASRQPFDLARGPLLRLALLDLGAPPAAGVADVADASEHLALLTLHHIVGDGWSLGVMVGELAAFYGAGAGGQAAALPELPIQYADFALWQRDHLAAGALDDQLDYWRGQLADAPVLELPADRPRAAGAAALGGTVELPLSADQGGVAGLAEAAQAAGGTLFMGLLAAFTGLLARLSEQTDLVVGTPVAGRDRVETQGLVGLFVNTLALRLDLADDPGLRALLARSRDVALAAFSRQELPFDRLVEELAPQRQLGRSPLIQAMLALQNAPVPHVELPGVVLTPFELDSATAQFDLTLVFEEGGVGRRPRAVLRFRRDLFDPATVARWGRHLVRWIAAAMAEPDRPVSQLPLLSPAERHQLEREWNDTAPAPDGAAEDPENGVGLHHLFEARAAGRPGAVALLAGEQEMTYGELDARAGELAAALRALGVGPEVRVGVCLDRSFELIVALLAIWKAGGAYVPLDPAQPRERLLWMVADAGIRLLLAGPERTAELFPAGPPDDLRDLRVLAPDRPLPVFAPAAAAAAPAPFSADQLAYVIYTSGSTGHPNGVLVAHRGAVNLLRQAAPLYRVTPESRVLQVASIGFDASLLEIFLALGHGASLCSVPEEERLSPGVLAGRLVRQGVTTAVLTPSFLGVLPEPRLPGLAALSVGGEACPGGLAARWAPGRRLLNCYGPTEATIFATVEVVAANGGAPDGGMPAIGRPVEGVEAHVLDAALLPVPIGAPGELALGGVGLARGYLDRPHRTAERFVPHPFASTPGERLYRTGDLVRRLPDGRLEFLGRMDHQVKIRGVRIELGEIEAVLRTHPAVLTAAVLAPLRAPSSAPTSAGAERRLLAWVVPQPGQEASPAELRRFLAERLPAAMVPIVPAHIVALDALPVTATGKLDRKALERRAAEIGTEERERTAPRTPADRLVARLWQEVLKVPEVGIDDDFFALGGSSIQAAILTNRLEEELGERVWVVALFDAPTVERLTAYLLATCPVGMARATGVGAAAAAASPAGETAKPPLPLRRRAHAGPPSLSFAQERLWFLDRLEPGSPAYVIPATVRLHGVLDVEALAASLAEVVRRHAVLRTRFGLDGGRPVQIVDDPVPDRPPALPRIDLAGLGVRAAAEAGRLAAAAAVRPFDLAEGPLLRAALLRLGREEHAVLVALHHIAGDAWSIGVLVAEMAALYPAFAARRPSPLPELPVQYADFAVWQR